MEQDADRIILVVEDDPDDLKLIKRAFSQNNIINKLIVVNDGADALDYLFSKGKYKDSNTLPQVVLLDMGLPKLNGLEVLQQIRAYNRTKFLPVLMLTSSTKEEDIINSYKFGANSYIRKPVDIGGIY